METWFVVVVTLCVSAILKSLFDLFFSSPPSKLPPGPYTFPVIGNFLWLRKSFSELEPILRDIRLKYGPLVTLRIGSHPAIFVGSHSLAHQALIQKGAVFSDRPRALAVGRILHSNQHDISSAAYGPLWRLLRRNLTSEILHPQRVKSYSGARRWVLLILVDRLIAQSQSESEPQSREVRVMDHFQHAMFCLLVLMCFGDKLGEDQIKQIEKVTRDLLVRFNRFTILNFWPSVGKIVFHSRWKELSRLRRNLEAVLIPLINARREVVNRRRQRPAEENGEEAEESVVGYVDTLLNLDLPEEKRKLDEGEMVTLCGEFINAGTDTTSTVLQWIMANLVKHPPIQAKLFQEIKGVVGPPPPPLAIEGKGEVGVINEEELQKMPYLKAVVLEALRRHPPGHFVLPHTVSKEVELDGYVVPRNATVNFMVAEMGWDPKVWDDPMEFRPERFLTTAGNGGGEEGFDITGSREIKMMPFGAGRRICPGSGLALLLLEYFVANLVWYFEWTAVDEVDLSEEQVFTVVMKNPLHVHLSPRAK